MTAFLILWVGQLSFGLGNCLWKTKDPAGYVAWKLIMFRTIASAVIFSLLYLFAGLMVPEFKSGFSTDSSYWKTLAWAVPASCIGFVFFIFSLRGGLVSVSVPVLAFISLFAAGTSMIFYGEMLNSIQWAIIPAMLIGLALLSGISVNYHFNRYLAFALIAALCWGTTIPAFGFLVREGGVLQLSLITEISVLLFALIALLLVKRERKNPRFDSEPLFHWSRPLLLGILAVAGVLGSNIYLHERPAIMMAFLTLTQPGISLLAARFYLKERLDYKQWIGISILLGSGLLFDFVKSF